MKRRDLMSAWLAAVLGSMLMLAHAAAGTAPGGDARVHVSWAPTASLSEVRDNPTQRGWMRPQEWQKQLATYLVRRADALLLPGQTLDVHIDDIKLAGAFEPWRGPDAQDIRFMKDIYPPRIQLHFKLLDADGKVLREGERKLQDLAYLQHSLPNTIDPLGYDKRLIGNWLSREFRRDQAAGTGAQRGA